MSEIQNLEKDLSNFVVNLENDVDTVFEDIIKGTSYAEQVITNILTDAIPATEAVVSVIDPQVITFVNIISQVLGDIKAIAENLNGLAQQASIVFKAPGGVSATISVSEAESLAKNALTTYNATIASIDNITAQLTPVVKNAVDTIAKKL